MKTEEKKKTNCTSYTYCMFQGFWMGCLSFLNSYKWYKISEVQFLKLKIPKKLYKPHPKPHRSTLTPLRWGERESPHLTHTPIWRHRAQILCTYCTEYNCVSSVWTCNIPCCLSTDFILLSWMWTITRTCVCGNMLR